METIGVLMRDIVSGNKRILYAGHCARKLKEFLCETLCLETVEVHMWDIESGN